MRYEILPNGTRLRQDDRFLKLGTDAILLAAACPKASHAVDLGCGVGNILLSIADRQPDCSLAGVELNPDAAAVCRQSVAENHLENRVQVITADLREIGANQPGSRDRFCEAKCGRQFARESAQRAPYNSRCVECWRARGYDLVVCNPPYLRDGSGKRSPNAARNLERFDTTASPTDVASAASALLKPNGTLMLVLRPDRLDDYLAAFKSTDLVARAICEVRHTADAQPSILLLESEYLGEILPPEHSEFILSDSFQEVLEGKPICLRSTSSRPR